MSLSIQELDIAIKFCAEQAEVFRLAFVNSRMEGKTIEECAKYVRERNTWFSRKEKFTNALHRILLREADNYTNEGMRIEEEYPRINTRS